MSKALPINRVHGLPLWSCSMSCYCCFLCFTVLLFGSRVADDAIRLVTLGPSVVKDRLAQFHGSDREREKTMLAMFAEAGCAAGQLNEQKVPREKTPNVICTLPGESGSEIIIGAHYDHADEGEGVIDNWPGASLLPSLLESIRGLPRHHTYVFIAFTGEEDGLVGSDYYVKSLSRQQMTLITAMVNLDTLGLGPTEVWTSTADPRLVNALQSTAKSLSLPLTGMNVERIGTTDSESFHRKKIPSITVHSLTQETLPILHSPRDRMDAVRFDAYYQSYRLLAVYAAYLDTWLPAGAFSAQAKPTP